MRLIVQPLLASVVLATLIFVQTSAVGSGPAAPSQRGAASGCSLFVSPRGDDHAADGSQAAPFATLEHALATARSQDGRTSTLITLLPGVYYLKQPVRITAADAGPAHPLTLTAQDGSAILSGGVAIEGWSWDATTKVWSAPVPAVFAAGKAPLRQLFIGGQRMPRPAVALAGPVNATTLADMSALPISSRPSHPKLLGYVATDRSVRSWPPNTVEAVYNGTAQEWTEHRCGVARVLPINSSATLVVMRQPCFELAMRRSGWSEKEPDAAGVGIPHYFENVRSALSHGQWCTNGTGATVDFKPPKGVVLNPEKHGAVSPAVESLLHIEATSHVTVTGIGLEHSAWFQPSTGTGYVSTQAGTFVTAASLASHNFNGWWMPSSALFVDGSTNITIDSCRVQRVGGAGVTFGGGSANSTVRRCSFDDISSSAVQLGGSVRSNGTLVVDRSATAQVGLSAVDNTIANSPAEFHDAVGIFAGYLSGAIIAHNTLENLSCEYCALLTSCTRLQRALAGWRWDAS